MKTNRLLKPWHALTHPDSDDLSAAAIHPIPGRDRDSGFDREKPGVLPPARRHAFTLVEMLIVVLVIGIVAAVAVPMVGSTSATTLVSAARLLVADIEFAQNESITHVDDARLIKVDQANSRYWLAKASDVNTPIDNPAGPGNMLVQFGSGRAAKLAGVTIQSYSLDGDTELHFDSFGQPDQTTNATIVLACGGATITVAIAPVTGEVTAQ